MDRSIKITMMIGSLLFLAGAISYLMKYDIVGLYIYLFCAIFFTFGSIIDLTYYEYSIRSKPLIYPAQ